MRRRMFNSKLIQNLLELLIEIQYANAMQSTKCAKEMKCEQISSQKLNWARAIVCSVLVSVCDPYTAFIQRPQRYTDWMWPWNKLLYISHANPTVFHVYLAFYFYIFHARFILFDEYIHVREQVLKNEFESIEIEFFVLASRTHTMAEQNCGVLHISFCRAIHVIWQIIGAWNIWIIARQINIRLNSTVDTDKSSEHFSHDPICQHMLQQTERCFHLCSSFGRNRLPIFFVTHIFIMKAKKKEIQFYLSICNRKSFLWFPFSLHLL